MIVVAVVVEVNCGPASGTEYALFVFFSLLVIAVLERLPFCRW